MITPTAQRPDPDLVAIRNRIIFLDAELFGTEFRFRVERDNKRPIDGRIFLQVVYNAACTTTGAVKEWHGRKWYLSDHMTEDEIVKTCFAAFKAAVEHEVMEAFRWKGQRVFNPHASFLALMVAGTNEVYREAKP